MNKERLEGIGFILLYTSLMGLIMYIVYFITISQDDVIKIMQKSPFIMGVFVAFVMVVFLIIIIGSIISIITDSLRMAYKKKINALSKDNEKLFNDNLRMRIILYDNGWDPDSLNKTIEDTDYRA